MWVRLSDWRIILAGEFCIRWSFISEIMGYTEEKRIGLVKMRIDESMSNE